MPTSSGQRSESVRLLARAVRELERTDARTPGAVRKAVARAVRADIGGMPSGKQHKFIQSIAKGFDDALGGPSGTTTVVNPRGKAGSVRPGGVPVTKRAEAEVLPGTPRATGRRSKASSGAPADDAFAEAMSARAELAKEGKLLEPAQFQERSGVSRQAIHQQTQTGSLFTVDGPKGVSYYPSFFADTKYDRTAVRRVARALKGLPGGSKWIFFTHPRHSLGGLTPLEVLSGAKPRRREGGSNDASVDLAAVLRAAAAYMEE
jgi:hypothetical protein